MANDDRPCGRARDATGSFTGLFLLCAGAVLAMLVATCFPTPPMIEHVA